MGIFYFLKRPKIIETKTFSEIPGFSFEYPVFKGWEFASIKKVSDSEYILYLNNPSNIDFDAAPQIKIVKSEYAYKGPNNSTIENNPNIKTNKNGAKYYMILRYDNPEISEGLPFMNFYASDSTVTIYPFMHEGNGYSGKVFVDKIIETFKFTCSPETIGALPLKKLVSQYYLYSEDYLKGLAAKGAQEVVKKLIEDKENPNDFYATTTPDVKTNAEGIRVAESVTYELSHKDDFKPENCNKVGNPSGKSRTMIYDIKQEKIVSDLLWK